MTPIEKNIFVVDEQGNTYEATYPKRAKGLVKNGRVRFVDETTICLACPPETERSDKTMSDNKAKQEVINTRPEQSAAPKQEGKYTLDYCLEQIEKILESQQDGFYTEVLTQLKELSSTGPGDIAGAEKAQAIGDAVKCRETTNQQLLTFYQKMYEDLKPKPNSRQQLINDLLPLLSAPIPDSAKEIACNSLNFLLQASAEQTIEKVYQL